MAVRTVADIDVKVVNTSITGSPTRVVKVFFPKRERKSDMLQGSVEEQVDNLIELLEGII